MGKTHPSYCKHGIMVDAGDTMSKAGYCEICEAKQLLNKNVLNSINRVLENGLPETLVQRIDGKFLRISIEYADQEALEKNFQHALTEALVARHILTKENSLDGAKALADLLNWEVAISLDTSVSQSARDLWEEGFEAGIAAMKNERD